MASLTAIVAAAIVAEAAAKRAISRALALSFAIVQVTWGTLFVVISHYSNY